MHFFQPVYRGGKSASRSHGTPLFLGALLLVLSGHVYAAGTTVASIGDAYGLETNVLLYSETHCVGNGLEREVVYRDAGQQLIAHKILRYQGSLTAPSFVARNYYSREVISIESAPHSITMSMMKMGESDPELVETVVVKPKPNMAVVIDAGFDNYVKSNWDKLATSESQVFQFPIATREILVELKISLKDCSYKTKTETCFSLEIDNWFLRLLSDPIELGYDTNLRRLSRYRGLSNIGDGDGEGLVVDLRYRYPDTPTVACNLAASELVEGEAFPDLLPGNAPITL